MVPLRGPNWNSGGNKTAALTPYKGYVYIRISSLTSARSITLGTDEFQELCSLKEEIPVEKAEKEIAKQLHKTKKQDTLKNKRVIVDSSSGKRKKRVQPNNTSEEEEEETVTTGPSNKRKKKSVAASSFISSEAVEVNSEDDE